MTLLHEVKQGHFLSATRDLSQPFEAGDWSLKSGVHCALTHRGVLQITPPHLASTAKDIVLSSGVHGNETAPIELIQQLARGILLGEITPAHRLLLIISHPEAINRHTRFIEENMNRLFREYNPERNVDCVAANRLQDAVNDFYASSPHAQPERWHLDLHCAIRSSLHYTFAVSPHSHLPSRSNRLFSFLEQAQIEAVLIAKSPSFTFSWFSGERHGAQAVTVELGKVNKFGENDLSILSQFNQTMLSLVTDLELPVAWRHEVAIYRVHRTLVKRTAELSFNFPDNLANFTFFSEGTHLGREPGQEFIAEAGGEAAVFANPNVAVGQRAALMVKKTRLIFDDQVRIAEDDLDH
jgi:succinylglutamate desuccinylase